MEPRSFKAAAQSVPRRQRAVDRELADMRRRTVGAFIALALLAGGTAQAVPPATGSPILGADTVVYSDRSASMTVQVPQAFHLNPWLFDVPASGYESDWCVYSGGPPPLGY